MSWPAYSERFLHHQAAGWWSYEVPAEKRAIVTAVNACNMAGTAGQFRLQIGPITMAYVQALAAYASINVATRQVAYQGELITIFLDAGMNTTISGYLLEDTTGRTGPPPSAASKPIRPELGAG